MKTKLSILLTSIGCLFLNGSALAADQEGNASAKVNGDETIYVEYRENFTERFPRPYNAMFNELDRFHYFSHHFKKAFEKEDWPVNFTFERFPVKAPEGAKVLEMTFLNLRSPSRIELELTMWAKLDDGSTKHDFGVIKVEHVPEPFATSSSVERDLEVLYTKVAEKVIKDLNTTLFSSE